MPAHHAGVNYPYAAQGTNMHYAPASHGTAPPGSYGPVYYPTTPIGHHQFNGDGFSAMQRLWDDMRRPEFNPKDYGAVNQVLMGMQSVALPIPAVGGGGGGGGGGGVGDYGSATAAGGYFGNGGGGGGGVGRTHFADMPTFPNVRTKKDLLEINEILQQMMSTAYEAPSPMTSGVEQPGNLATHYGTRNSQSPPSVHIPRTHTMTSMDGASNPSSTPGLTPGSSAMSYTSGHSPPASFSNMHSPTATQPQQQQPSYPTLPSTSADSGAGMVVDALGTPYDRDPRQRYSGGNQQRAAPSGLRRGRYSAPHNNMDLDQPSSSTKASRAPTDINIDPLLANSSSNISSRSSSSSIASDDTTTQGREEEAARGRNFRVLEHLRSYVSSRLNAGIYDDEDGDEDGEIDDAEEGEEEGKLRRALAKASTRAEEDEEEDERSTRGNVAVSYPRLM
jgi:hypothetical protein